jgi:Rrf2 family iron-sulfur cluster assembly transcriptional regulator
MTHELWTGLNDHIYTYLESVDLAKLVSGQMACQEKEARRRSQRVIGSAELKAVVNG